MSTVLIGYDGSAASDRAVHAARAVVVADRAIVVTVWEPNLTSLVQPGIGELSLSGATMDPRTEQVFEVAMKRSAEQINARGKQVAGAAGYADTVAVVEAEGGDIATTLIRLAAEHDAVAIVVGSHGHGGFVARVMGTTSSSLVRDATCPVLVIPAGAPAA